MSRPTFLYSLVLCIASFGVPVDAGFSNNSNNGTFVAEVGEVTGTIRVNALNEAGQMRTAANSAINPADPTSYSTEVSGVFSAFLVSSANYACGADFDILFDNPVVGIVATNALAWGSAGGLGIDLLSALSAASSSIPDLGGNHFLGLEISQPGMIDSVTVNGNQVTGSVSSPIPLLENFFVLTSGSSTVASPEPGAIAVWALLGLVASLVGWRRLRHHAAA